FFSSDFNRDEGVVDYNWQNKYSGRANVSYTTPNDKLKVDVSLGAIRSRARGASGVQPITTSILWACNFPGCEPKRSVTNGVQDSLTTGWNDAGHGYQFYRPEDYDGVAAYDNIDRVIFSLALNYRPLPWLRHRLTVGPDFTNNKSSKVVNRYPTARRPFFTSSDGLAQARQNRATFLT